MIDLTEAPPSVRARIGEAAALELVWTRDDGSRSVWRTNVDGVAMYLKVERAATGEQDRLQWL